MFTFLVLYL
jgi:hypothetical protein